MNVAVVGTGYVGLVMGAGLAEMGNAVVCADVDAGKIERLRRGEVPIYEPGLEPMVTRNQAEGRLSFTTDVGEAVQKSDIVFIAVGTPPDEDGSADLSHVLDVAVTIGRHMNRSKVVVTKSTVPVGTAEKVRAAIAGETAVPFHLASNPEFLKEGAAVQDFMKPDRIVLGVQSPEAEAALRELYEPFVRSGNPILFMDIPSAEVTKYAANAMLAARIALMNQLAALCERVGADVDDVRAGIGSDARLGKAFLFPGPGYGGSCFPKDVKALCATGREVGARQDILECVDDANQRQKRVALEKLERALGTLAGRTVAVWGLAFKAQTDDMREAAALVVIDGLLAAGAAVRVHDPKALDEARRRFGGRIGYVERRYDALEGADALVVLTEWQEYRVLDYERARSLMRRPVVIDARNLYEPARMRQHGFSYDSIGRGRV
ncbi:MAG TPA: UDP-glucose/GDP-mannose dehydrogenase family protein [Gemmatimonadales bacterium]|nr:UDP-glucose/GDP-mannose dehydrogenase family protein [Gemmatimonadales bacterium]